MEPNLALSWLGRAQVGAKRGKLTLLGGLRGIKLELKEALGSPKEASRESKRAMAHIGAATRGVLFWPGGLPKVT